MKHDELERQHLKKQIRKHMEGILGGGVSRQELADTLHVTKQAVSSYLTGRTTPKTHIVRRLLAEWPHNFTFRDVQFGPEAFGTVPDEAGTLESKQDLLFDVLSGVKKENLRLEVERVRGSEAELRVIIKIAG
jgi:hypothetical protein